MKSILTISLLTLLMSCSISQQKKDASNTKDTSFEMPDNYADTLLMDTLINSLSIGVYFNGEEKIKHYGELDKGKNNKPTNKTIYEIASVTKTFVGTLIAQAEIEGKLSIEDDIRKHLAGEYPNLEYKGQPIKIKHLLTHTSRFPRFLPTSINDLFEEINDELPFKIVEIEKNYSRDQFFKDLKDITIDTMPGTRYSYSNADTELAAHILERVYQKPFERLLEENICKEANMLNTRIKLNEDQKKHLANGYGGNGKTTPYSNTNLWGGSGSGKSTMPDLLNYIKLQLDKENKAVQTTHQILYDKEVIYGDPNNKIGYFWVLNKDEDLGTSISHHGGAFGMQNFMIIYPEIDLGISVATNQGHWGTGGKLMYIINGILEEIKKTHNNKQK